MLHRITFLLAVLVLVWLFTLSRPIVETASQSTNNINNNNYHSLQNHRNRDIQRLALIQKQSIGWNQSGSFQEVGKSASTHSVSIAKQKTFGFHEEDRIHIMFSTDCTSFQHWQAVLLLMSASRVGQRGVQM